MISKDLTITKRLGRYHNLPINDNNNDNSSSQSYFNKLEQFYKDDTQKSLLDWNKPLFGNNSTSLQKVLANANKTIEKSTKFINKIKSRQLACANRAKSIPENVTIRKEYIRCGKEMCELEHGPYYYAYWKDPESKKLKKKYIGDHMPKKERLENNSNNNQVL
jgi:hypothetical protein